VEERGEKVGAATTRPHPLALRDITPPRDIRAGGVGRARGTGRRRHQHAHTARLPGPRNPHSNSSAIQPLTYDGAYVGCLYCVVSDREEENHELSKHFLYMHKIEVAMLEPDAHGFRMRVLKNE
jgi:hypothetical protein